MLGETGYAQFAQRLGMEVSIPEAPRLPPRVNKALRFAQEYAIDCDIRATANRVGVNPGYFHNRLVQALVRRELDKRAEVSALKAEYVRQYIHNVLEFRPLDFFEPAEGGGWEITKEKYDSLPEHVKAMVADVELRHVRGVSILGVKFVSKDSALSLAARYTLIEKHEVGPPTLSWDEVAGLPPPKQVEDPIEVEIAKVEALPAPSANGHAA